MKWVKFVIRNSHFFMPGIAGMVFGVHVAPQTIGLSRYRSLLQHYTFGMETKINPNLIQISQDILDVLELPAEDEANITFFTAYGQEMTHRGSTQLKTGAIIGLPTNLNYTTKDDIEKDKWKVEESSISWESEAGKQLEESLILGENAKKFAIARELFYVKTHHVTVEALIASGSILLSFISCIVASDTFLKQAPRLLKSIVYIPIWVVGYIMYTSGKDNYFCYRDRRADEKAAMLGTEYAEGAVEFYSKLLQRNAALRTLFGENGPKYYTVYGNQVQKWHDPHMSLTSRRDASVDYLKKNYLDKNNEENATAA